MGATQSKKSTPWERITDGFRAWLVKSGVTAEEYNALAVVERVTLRTQYDGVKPTAYFVGAIVQGAIQSNGARGNVYKFLQKHVGYYSEQEGIQVFYEQDDLVVKAYFLASEAASQFQNSLDEWEIHKDLLNFRGVSLDPLTPLAVEKPQDLKRIYQ